MKFKKNNLILIINVFLLICFFILGCNDLKKIKNKKIGYCNLYNNFGGGTRNSYSMIYNYQKYIIGGYGIHGGVENEDKYIALFDSTRPENFYPLYFMPIIDSLESYDTTFAIVNMNNSHYIPLYSESYYTISFGFKFMFEDDTSKSITVYRGQIFRKSEKTKFIENLKEGAVIKIIYNIDNPKKAFIKLDNYYLTSFNQYKD